MSTQQSSRSLGFDEIGQRLDVAKSEAAPRHGVIESDLATVDSRDGQSQRYRPSLKVEVPGFDRLYLTLSPELKRSVAHPVILSIRLLERAMRIILAAIIVALAVLPAQAQHKRGKKPDEAQQQLSAEQKKKALEAEKAYKAALDKVPDQKPVDPWSNMR
jgi:hypothetical protein